MPYVHVYICVEVSGQCWMTSSISLNLIFFRQGLSLRLELTDLFDWLASELQPHPALRLQKSAIVLSFRQALRT